MTALGVGQLFALVAFATQWAMSDLGRETVAMTELFLVITAVLAVGLFGWTAARPWLAHGVIYAFVGVLTVVLGRLVASAVFVAVTAGVSRTADPAGVPEVLSSLAPAALGLAVRSVVETMMVPELLGLLCGVAILGQQRGELDRLQDRLA